MEYEHEDAIRSAVRRARIVKVDDSGTQQLVDLKGLKSEEPQKIYRVMPFGHFSVPPADSEGLMVQMGGRSDRTVYFEGGHKDYRPKKRPAGSAGLFDQYGNLIQSDKDGLGFTHASKINLQLGKGYDAKDVADYNGPSVSIVLSADALTLSFGSSSIKLADGKITLTATSIVADGMTDLGGEGGLPVDRTDNDPAIKVRAV